MEWVVETALPQEIRKLASAIEKKDAALVLMNVDLRDSDNKIQVIQYEKVALQPWRDVDQVELQRCQNTIIHLRTHYVEHARNPGKSNIIIIVRKHTTPANDRFHDLPYFVARIQRRKRYVKLRWFDKHFTDHDFIVEINNPNSIHAFNWFDEEGHTEQKHNRSRLIDLTREELYAQWIPAILDNGEE